MVDHSTINQRVGNDKKYTPRDFSSFQSFYPPTIITVLGERRYAIIDGKWILVNKSVTLPFLMSLWSKETVVKANQAPIDYREFEVTSHSSNNIYSVRYYNTGLWTCSCPGYGFRRKCSHITDAKSYINANS